MDKATHDRLAAIRRKGMDALKRNDSAAFRAAMIEHGQVLHAASPAIAKAFYAVSSDEERKATLDETCRLIDARA